jgi:hypothetical protein
MGRFAQSRITAMRHSALMILSGLCTALAGCSSLSGGGGQQTEIVTDPPGAECVVAGAGYRQVVRTPDGVSPPISAAPLTFTCTAPGHRTAEGPLHARFDNRIISNLVFGSSLGVAIDMMNGRDTVFPRQYRVHMEPVAFRTEAMRDAWYARFRSHVAEKWDRAIAARTLGCTETESGYGCIEERNALRQGRDRELDALDARRRAAQITGETVAEEPHPLPRVY